MQFYTQKNCAKEKPFKEEVVTLNQNLQKKIGSWAKEGVECFGLVTLANKKKIVEYGKSVKIVLVVLKNDSVKVKALEDVNLAKPMAKDCTKLGITTGYTWWEVEGDLFLTREEADGYLKSKGWEIRKKEKGKFKVGD